MSTFRTVVECAIGFAQAQNTENDEIREAEGRGDEGLDFMDPGSHESIYAPRPVAIALKQYLLTLDLPTLQKLEIFMYWGRDDSTLAGIRSQLAQSSRTKERVVDDMTSKTPFPTYLERALAKAKAERIDIEKPF